MKKLFFITSLLFTTYYLTAQTQTQDLNMGLYKLQFPSANGGNNRIQSFGGSFPGTWLFKSRFDDIHIDAGENSSNSFKIFFKTGGIERARFSSNGNFGIGTTNPSDALHIATDDATLRLSSSTYFGGNGGALNTILSKIKFVNRDQNHDYRSEIRGILSGGWASQIGLSFTTHSGGQQVERMRINHDGTIGIGTTDTKGFKLGVQGKIAAEEVKVAAYTNWADFVFKNDYDLPTLKEVEEHIKEKGHLKDIPSAEAVKKDGFFLGDMDSKLLRKIEELTLYTIEQEKELKNQKEINKTLEERLQKIEKLLNYQKQ